MEPSKQWYESFGVWGGVFAVIAGVATLWGYSITPADQATLAQAAAGLGSAIGGAMGVWGRIKASKTIQ